MQIATSPTNVNPFVKATDTTDAAQSALMSSLSQYQIIRRNGAVVPFEPAKIAVAMMKAFLAVHGTQGAASSSVRETVDQLTQVVTRALMRSRPGGGTFHIEDVQDQVELGLMRGSHHEVARSYVLYRERRSQERAAHKETTINTVPQLHAIVDGERVVLDTQRLQQLIEAACENLGADVTAAPILTETMRNLYDGIPMEEVHKASVLAARTMIEKEPGYTFATARLLMYSITKEV
jgi:ribonucleoside-diphosphate reductase alpha chain